MTIWDYLTWGDSGTQDHLGVPYQWTLPRTVPTPAVKGGRSWWHLQPLHVKIQWSQKWKPESSALMAKRMKHAMRLDVWMMTMKTREGVGTPRVDFLKPKQKKQVGCWNVRTLYRASKWAQTIRDFEMCWGTARPDGPALSSASWHLYPSHHRPNPMLMEMDRTYSQHAAWHPSDSGSLLDSRRQKEEWLTKVNIAKNGRMRDERVRLNLGP